MTTMIPRSRWTNTPDNRNQPLNPDIVEMFVLHYPATPGNIGKEPIGVIANMLEGWRRYHVNTHGWRDIGYNYAVDQAGRLYFLTGDDVGAHANTVGNTRGLGVLCILGNNEKPSKEMIATLQWLYATKRRKFPRMDDVRGHKQVPGNSTACPGSHLTALADSNIIQSGRGSVPGPEEDDIMAGISPKELFDIVWRGDKFQELDKGTEYPRPAETPGSRLNAITSRVGKAVVISRQTRTRVAGLEKAIAAIGEASGIDKETVERIIRESAESALKDVSITLKVDDEGDES